MSIRLDPFAMYLTHIALGCPKTTKYPVYFEGFVLEQSKIFVNNADPLMIKKIKQIIIYSPD